MYHKQNHHIAKNNDDFVQILVDFQPRVEEEVLKEETKDAQNLLACPLGYCQFFFSGQLKGTARYDHHSRKFFRLVLRE